MGRNTILQSLRTEVGHNAGATVFTGGAIRARIYFGWGLDAIDVVRACVLAGFTFWLGNATVRGLGIAFEPQAATAIDPLPPPVNRALGLLILSILASYITWVRWAPPSVQYPWSKQIIVRPSGCPRCKGESLLVSAPRRRPLGLRTTPGVDQNAGGTRPQRGQHLPNLAGGHDFVHRYDAVKRFVARLKARVPERFDVADISARREGVTPPPKVSSSSIEGRLCGSLKCPLGSNGTVDDEAGGSDDSSDASRLPDEW